MRKVTSLPDLYTLADSDYRYTVLALDACENLGADMNRIRTIDDAYAYLTIQAIEAGYDMPEIDAAAWRSR
jgi:hypothetical protein